MFKHVELLTLLSSSRARHIDRSEGLSLPEIRHGASTSMATQLCDAATLLHLVHTVCYYGIASAMMFVDEFAMITLQSCWLLLHSRLSYA